MESMYAQYYQEPKYRPSYVSPMRIAAGLLGRKTGRGWYTYTKAGAVAVPEQPVPAARASTVWVAPDAPALRDLAGKLGAKIETGAKPGKDALCMVAPLGKDATTAATGLGLDATRTVAVDPLFGFAKRRTLMTTPVTTAEARDAAHGLLASDGVPVSLIRDSAGFVAQRVVAHVVNVGCDIAQMRIAAPADLDRAVVLGLSYPYGPLAFGDAVGPAKVLEILANMHAFYEEPRYRPSPWLKRRAALGVSLLTAE
jgi:3-hydroxybutyryl-CoA dehydrogenase